MIESCPKKRMLLGITVLGILTILVLFIESHWTESTRRDKKSNFIVEQNSTCWEAGNFEVIKECEPCTDGSSIQKEDEYGIDSHGLLKIDMNNAAEAVISGQ
uniref:Uncharacterized protein LOC114333088 n=1 Tax=Diabrotica virgifera virgifera TaxID=50390 RepID=A0A6P7FVE4_DIAVI